MLMLAAFGFDRKIEFFLFNGRDDADGLILRAFSDFPV
jgi:hypothetical protein